MHESGQSLRVMQREAAPRVERERADPVADAIRSARARLLDLQHADGHWCAELEGDVILGAEYILTLYFLGLGSGERVRKAASYLRAKQLVEGGWAIYPGGPAEASVSTKAYFALKLAGDDPQASHLVRAREVIRRLGGLDACNSVTKILLAVFGQYEWERCPAVPPELILLPNWCPFSISAMSSWTRAIFVPLSLVWALKPRCAVPEGSGVAELRVPRRPAPPPAGREARLWVALFRAVDFGLKLLERLRLRPLRRLALARAERWALARLEQSDGLGAIFPPIVNSLLGLRARGYPLDHPVIQGQIRELERLEIEEGETLRVQPCRSPVWDTALAANALVESGLPADHPALQKAARWLVDREVRAPGDWRVRNPQGPVGGWYFEYANEFYPDCDDTAQVLTALAKLRLGAVESEARRRAASERGLAWLLSMQNRDGGWASFDKGCDKRFLTFVPFADHNAMIDPSTSDITSRVLETLAAVGAAPLAEPARRAVAFVRREQEADGTWYGRWGCNYIYGTFLALWGLRAAGQPTAEKWAQRAAEWLRRHQNLDGGWGELPLSYDDPSQKGRGPSTAAQTAWALLALDAAGDAASPSVRRGIEYLLRTQRADGGWRDEPWTGTGFPRVFYLRYHLYATYFPLLALSAHARARS